MNKLSLKLKLFLAFAFLSAVVFAVGMLGYRSVGQLAGAIKYVGQNELPGVEAVLKMEYYLSKMSRDIRVFSDPLASVEERAFAAKNLKETQSAYAEVKAGYEALDMTAEESSVLVKFRERSEVWSAVKSEIVQLNLDLKALGILNPDRMGRQLESFRSDFHKGIGDVVARIELGEALESPTDFADSNYAQWVSAYSGKNLEVRGLIDRSVGTAKDYYDSLARIADHVDAGDLSAARAELAENLLPLEAQLDVHFDALAGKVEEAESIFASMLKIEAEEAFPLEKENMAYLDELVALRIKDSNKAVDESVAMGYSARTAALVITLVGVGGAMGYGLFFGGRLSRDLNEISLMVDRSAEETKVAAEQVSEASSSLAEGASEQAASLEETSSAMEEMTSMVSRDAELAASTAEQALEAHRAVKAGVQSIAALRGGVDAAGSSAKDLSEAMDGIKTSSDSISKIIRTIDEIAFQTNILALNASVEAARAGEAGAGFAVVAEEVRSLAHRAANAARETQTLVEESIGRSDEGVRMNQNVNERLDEVLSLAGAVESELDVIVSSVTVVDQSMGELRASLDEQQSGIIQINTGVTQISDVTQLNAASAEESASASEELNAQAYSLVDVVDGLSELVNGKGSKKKKPELMLSGPSVGQPLLGASS